jgi:hypothetical protein
VKEMIQNTGDIDNPELLARLRSFLNEEWCW